MCFLLVNEFRLLIVQQRVILSDRNLMRQTDAVPATPK
jgi:hypothetical protein